MKIEHASPKIFFTITGIAGILAGLFLFNVMQDKPVPAPPPSLAKSTPDKHKSPEKKETPSRPKAVVTMQPLVPSPPPVKVENAVEEPTPAPENSKDKSPHLNIPSRYVEQHTFKGVEANWLTKLKSRLDLPFNDSFEEQPVGKIISAFESAFDVTILINEDHFDKNFKATLLSSQGMTFRQALDALLDKMGYNLGWTLQDGTIMIDDTGQMRKHCEQAAINAAKPPRPRPDYSPKPGDSEGDLHIKATLKAAANEPYGDQPLEQLISALERAYNVHIIVSDEVDKSAIINLPVRNMTFEQALNILVQKIDNISNSDQNNNTLEMNIRGGAIHIEKKLGSQ